MIIDYLRYLVIDWKVSSSYQNQAINPIKFYFVQVLGVAKIVYLIERPREETLPIVLNETGISYILKAAENLKHKTNLMTCYAAGLRLSELINLKLKDIDSEREQIRITSRRNLNRYFILYPKLLVLLREYFTKYLPKI